MTRFADPLHCPDCGSPLPSAVAQCPGCGLLLRGPLADRLLRTLAEADAILAAMRAEPPPTPPGSAAAPVRRGITTASVPRLLLGLGAACLLVAALVFLAVTWSVLGVGCRTAVLVGATAVTGAVTGWSAARGLRGTVEAVGLVCLGLVALDLAGGWSAGWFAGMAAAAFAVVAGLGLAVVAGGSVLAVRRTPARRFTAGEVVVAVGGAVAAAGLPAGAWWSLELRLLLGVLLTSVLAGVAAVIRARVAAAGTALVVVGTWSALVLAGLDRLGTAPSLRSVWVQGDGWPLLAAAAVAVLAGLAARSGSVPQPVGVACLGAGLLLVAVTVAAPVLDEAATSRLVVVLGVTLAAAVATLAARPWGAAAVVPLAAGLLWSAAATVHLGAVAVARLLGLAADPWAGTPSSRLDHLGLVDAPAPWLLPVGAVVVLAGAGAALRVLAGVTEPPALRRLAAAARGEGRMVATAAVVGGLTGTLVLYSVPVWTLLAAPLTVAAATTAELTRTAGRAVPGRRAGGPEAAAVTVLAWLAMLALAAVPALSDAWLTLAAAAAAMLCAAWLLVRCAAAPVPVTAGIVLPVAVAAVVWTVAALAGAGVPERSMAALVAVAGTVGLLTAVRGGLLAGPTGLVGVETAAALVAALLACLGVVEATEPVPWLAGSLTVAAAGAAAVAVLRADRRWVFWPAGGLLVAASWLWLADRSVTAPEPYTLPSAAALLVVGLLRLRRTPGSRTGATLAPALVLALGPSLGWALADPESLRTLLLGAACVVLVLGGARLRWAAPLLAGAAAGALLVLRLAAPYLAVGVPRWLLLALAGVALVALGVSWERRLREARAALGHLRALR